MAENLSVALLTQALAAWSKVALGVLAAAAAALLLLAAWGVLRPSRLPRGVYVAPALLSIALIGTFERVREFIRKPYAIADYLYSNGFRKDDYPLLQRDGILARATYTSVRSVTRENQVEAGREVFVLACTRCHTTDGINGIRGLLVQMYGEDGAWSHAAISSYVGAMHNARPFMPPFPGNTVERDALASFLVSLQRHPASIEGAQVSGVEAPPPVPRGEANVVSAR